MPAVDEGEIRRNADNGSVSVGFIEGAMPRNNQIGRSCVMKTTWSVAIMCALFLSGGLVSAHAATVEAEDMFSSGNYTGGTGWTSNWTESGDDGSSTTGDIQINSQQLEFVGDGGGSNGYIYRELDLSNLADDGGVLLFFDITHSDNLESLDIFEVYARNDSGSAWTEIRQFNGEIPFEGLVTRTMTLDISDFNGDDTAIRFGIAQGVTDAGEAFTIDNVEISSTPNRITLEHDELFGGAVLPTASSTNTVDEAQIFDPTNQPYSDDGLVISLSDNSNGPIMLFDTSDPTGGDTDLGAPNGDDNTNNNNCGANAGITFGVTPGVSNADTDGDGFNDAALGHAGENCRPLGNVLIISEDGIKTDPDDDGAGGTISFDFDAPVEFGAVKFIDDLGGSVTLRFDGGGSETKDFTDLIDFPSQGENGVFLATFKDFDQDTNVIGFDVSLDGSGTVGALFGEPPSIDYGDALDSYSTLKATSGPSHRIEPNGRALHLGSAPDSESDGEPSTDALGDDAAASDLSPFTVADFDDEDGVTFSSIATLLPGATFTATLTATNQIGASATACGWIDFNDDGDFDNAEASGGNNAERICVSIPNATADGTFDLDFTIPDDFVFDGGGDGVYFSRFRITTDWASAAASSPTGSATDGEVEDFVIDTETLPVSIHSFESRYENGGLVIEWGTVSETRNAGFAVWGDRGDGAELLTSSLIAGGDGDPLQPRQYSHRIADVVPGEFKQLFVTAVDVNGKERLYGDFEPARAYGQAVSPAPIRWDRIQSASKLRMAEREASSSRAAAPAPASAVDVSAAAAGMIEVTYEQLAGAGLNLSNVPASRIAVTLKGEPVVRHVAGASEAAPGQPLFGPGASVRFWADLPEVPDALYVNHYSFRIADDPANALPADLQINEFTGFVDSFEPEPPPGSAIVGSYTARQTREDDLAYHFASPLVDPWYTAHLRAGRNDTHVATFNLDSASLIEQSGALRVRIAGLTDFPQAPDHRVLVDLNGQTLGEKVFEGQSVVDLDLDVPAGLLQAGPNLVRVVAPGGTQAPADIQLLDRIDLLHTRRLEAVNGRLLVEQRLPAPNQALVASGFGPGPVAAYARLDGRLIVLESERDPAGTVSVPSFERQADYWISSAGAIHSATDIRGVPDADLLAGSPDLNFVVIAHPTFMPLSTEELHPLNDFVEARQAEGWNIGLFDVSAIQQQYGWGMPLPEAVNRFLAAANEALGFEHVLLVGGDSFDYTDNLGLGSISFIPTHYRSAKYIPHAPADPLLADLNGDGRPDKALGRWPVRSLDDLRSIVTKTLDWDADPAALSNAVWVTDSQDPNQASFVDQAAALSDTLIGSGWSGAGIAGVHFDQIVPPPGVSRADAAREDYFGRLEQGRSLSGFVGHGSAAMWTFQGLLTADDISDLSNEGFPTLIGTMTCYTTYFVSPSSDTVAHRWMNGYREDALGNAIPGVPNGAVAVHGAGVLSNYGTNGWFARTVLQHQLNGETLGRAIELTRDSIPDGRTALFNWILLGDPTLRLD